MTRRLHGVVYPDPAPTPRTPVDERDVEHLLARRYIREAFDPPLPDIFADWYVQLHGYVREGYTADSMITVPGFIIDLGFTFERAEQMPDNTWGLTLSDALGAYGRSDLVAPVAPEPFTAEPGQELHPGGGVVALAAALAAYQIRSTVTVHHIVGACTVQFTDAQAQRLADLLIPVEGSVEDHLAEALELLDEFVDKPRPTPCSLDHHGHCQEHHDDFANETRFAQHEAYALLVRHGVRKETP